MAAISTNTNHDDLSRTPGEVITISQGAILTIDSMPQHTTSGILGDINFSTNGGEINIDGRNVREITYTTGTGTIPSVGGAVSWTGGSGKVIRLNSGTNVSGIMTITVQSGTNPSGTITNGSWSASVSSDRVGLLMVFGITGVWDAIDATCTLRIRGDWYEIGTGTGLDNQSITLPHSGVQPAVWVETGNGTGVYEIWHRVYNGGDSSIFFDSISDWGSHYESGKVFESVPLSGVLTFGTSMNGGVPPSGAKIRIPSVHMGTTTTATPFNEVSTLVIANHLAIIDGSVSENVFIDHLNASTVQASFIQTNSTEVSDSCFSLHSTTTINKINTTATFTNCAWVAGNSLAGETLALSFMITDNVGGVVFNDCLWYEGANAGKGMFFLTTMANCEFNGINKIVSNQQDENTMFTISGSVAGNITANGTLILLNNGITALAGCTNWYIEKLVYGQVLGRGTAEDSLYNSITGTDKFRIDSLAIVNGGRAFKSYQFTITDSSNITIRNFGEVDNKIDFDGIGLGINLAGITNNCLFQRIYFTNMSAAQLLYVLNSCADIVMENCGTDYNDEVELDGNRLLVKGCHGGSGNVGTTTGVEDDLVNVIGTVFYDIFKSDTTGGIGLVFNDRGRKHLGDVIIDSGTPIWNGIGDLIMQTVGDQVTFYFPYFIKGHTGFESIFPHIIGVNAGALGTHWGNFSIEYDLDTGSGYSGSFKVASVENLTSETISPAGFKIAIRIKVITASITNSIRGLQIHTATTIAAQKANLYPLSTAKLELTGLVIGSEVRVCLGVPGVSAVTLANTEAVLTSTFTMTHSNAGSLGFIMIHKPGWKHKKIILTFVSTDQSIPIQQEEDIYYKNSIN